MATNSGKATAKSRKKRKKKKAKGGFSLDNRMLIIAMVTLTVVIIGVVIGIASCHNNGGGDDKGTDANQSTTTAGSNFEQPTTSVIKADYPFVITGPSVYVRRDGSVLSAEVEDFEKDYYSVEEFETNFLVPEVKKYNNDKYGVNAAYTKDAAGNLGAAINSLTMSGQSLVLQMDYASTEDFIGFNKAVNKYFKNWNTFKVEKLSDMELPDVSLVDKNGVTKTLAEIKAEDPTLYVCTVGYGGNVPTGFSGRFVFEGAVVYTSEGAGITGENSARLYDSEALQYIIFE